MEESWELKKVHDKKKQLCYRSPWRDQAGVGVGTSLSWTKDEIYSKFRVRFPTLVEKLVSVLVYYTW